MMSTLSLANTSEIKEKEIKRKEPVETIKTFLTNEKIVEGDITICFETRRNYEQISEYLTLVTITYRCSEYLGLGKGTVYIDAE